MHDKYLVPPEIFFRPPGYVGLATALVNGHATRTQNGTVCSLLSAWVTTTDRLLGPIRSWSWRSRSLCFWIL